MSDKTDPRYWATKRCVWPLNMFPEDRAEIEKLHQEHPAISRGVIMRALMRIGLAVERSNGGTILDYMTGRKTPLEPPPKPEPAQEDWDELFGIGEVEES